MPAPLLDPHARDAAFALAFGAGVGPSGLSRFDRPEAAALLAATGASPAACAEAAAATRRLCDAAIEVGDWIREGALEPGDPRARARLARIAPGFEAMQYDVALTAGLWFTR